MTAETRRAPASATNDPLQLAAQPFACQVALFLVPALAAVAFARVPGRMQADEVARAHTLFEEQVAQGLRQAAGAIVLFDDHEALLLLDAREEVGRNLVHGKHAHVPDLEVVEQTLIAELVQVSQ